MKFLDVFGIVAAVWMMYALTIKHLDGKTSFNLLIVGLLLGVVAIVCFAIALGI